MAVAAKENALGYFAHEGGVLLAVAGRRSGDKCGYFVVLVVGVVEVKAGYKFMISTADTLSTKRRYAFSLERAPPFGYGVLLTLVIVGVSLDKAIFAVVMQPTVFGLAQP